MLNSRLTKKANVKLIEWRKMSVSNFLSLQTTTRNSVHIWDLLQSHFRQNFGWSEVLWTFVKLLIQNWGTEHLHLAKWAKGKIFAFFSFLDVHGFYNENKFILLSCWKWSIKYVFLSVNLLLKLGLSARVYSNMILISDHSPESS